MGLELLNRVLINYLNAILCNIGRQRSDWCSFSRLSCLWPRVARLFEQTSLGRIPGTALPKAGSVIAISLSPCWFAEWIIEAVPRWYLNLHLGQSDTSAGWLLVPGLFMGEGLYPRISMSRTQVMNVNQKLLCSSSTSFISLQRTAAIRYTWKLYVSVYNNFSTIYFT